MVLYGGPRAASIARNNEGWVKNGEGFLGSFVLLAGGGRYLLQEVEMKTFMVLAIVAVFGLGSGTGRCDTPKKPSGTTTSKDGKATQTAGGTAGKDTKAGPSKDAKTPTKGGSSK